MGEGKRRKKLDPNWVKSGEILEKLEVKSQKSKVSPRTFREEDSGSID